MFHPKYRPEIDGLRAFSVISVIAFHTFPEYASGGFIGVDIFFVISGYLISTIIYKSLDENSFRFIEFYQHRIRRIFPALIAVILSTFLFGKLILFPNELVNLGKHILGGSLFVSNIVLWNESGYFDKDVQVKTLMHLWSLGIEEQFYLIWPPILIVIWQMKKRWIPLLIMVACSFAYCLYKTYTAPFTAFFSPLARFWELGAGAVCAYYIYQSSPKKLFFNPKGISSIIIGVTLAVPIFIYSESMHFPGFIAVIPVIGSSLVLGFINHETILGKLLSNKIMKAIGLISYPLYLWHWPILSFLYIVAGGIAPIKYRLLGIVAMFSLATLTYFLIEKPLRYGGHANMKSLSLIILMLILGYVGYSAFDPNSFFDLIFGKTL